MQPTAEITFVDDGPAEARTLTRYLTRMPAGVRERGKPGGHTVVLDLSATGCRIASRPEYRPGIFLWVRFANLEPWPAKVVWNDGVFTGCAFERPLHPAVVERLLQTGRT
jgi:hypothetical protein